MRQLLSNYWSSKVFYSYNLNVNDNLKLQFIQNLKNNEPLNHITDMRLKSISLEEFPFFLFPSLKFIYFNDTFKMVSFKDLCNYCKNIEYISIWDIDITELPENFGNLDIVKIISISSTNINSISETIGNCILLKELYLHDNQNLFSLPPSLKNCCYLKNISILNCNFYEFPKVLCELENLKDLDISDNNISEIPNEISSLKYLEHLRCNNTRVYYLPDSIKECKKLKELQFKYSYLETLPEVIGELEELIYLELRGTKISKLPDTIGDCLSLETIDLDNTPLETLPNTIIKLKKIKRIFTDFTLFNEKNETIYLDISREGNFDIKGRYKVKYISSFQNEREKKIKYIMSQKDFIVPNKYKCNICYQIFKVPRTTIEGNTYCKDCILRWFSEKNTDPNINKNIENKILVPHHLFENDLNEFINENYEKYYQNS